MAIVINGSGTITGISAGGLPDGTVTADDLASTLDLSGKTVTLPTATTVDELSTATGSAPSYSARAWVNFNGTGTVAIRDSGNVSSITDNGTGNYTVNFTTAMPDVNYSVVATTSTKTARTGTTVCEILDTTGTPNITTTTAQVTTSEVSSVVNRTPTDRPLVSVAIFR